MSFGDLRKNVGKSETKTELPKQKAKSIMIV